MREFWKSTKTKMLFIHVFSLLLLYVVIWILLNWCLFRPLEEERKRDIANYADQITVSVANQKIVYEQIIYQLRANNLITENLTRKCETSTEIWQAMRNVKYLMQSYVGIVPAIQKLEIHVRGGDLWTDGKYLFVEKDEYQPEVRSGWIPISIDGTVYYRIGSTLMGIYHPVEAYVKLEIDCQRAFGSFMYFLDDIGGKAYVVDSEGNIVAASQRIDGAKKITEVIPDYEDISKFSHVYEKGSDLIFRQKIDDYWSAVVIIPSVYIREKMGSTYLIIGIAMLGIAIVTSLVFWGIMSDIMKRINRLTQCMDHFWDQKELIEIRGEHDELYRLEKQYNKVIKRLDDTLEEMTDVRTQKQKFEIRALEAQINPHFLYNTLGVMRWEALDGGNRRLVEMIDNLTVFYRRSLNKGSSFLTVSQEMELIKAYIAIQQERYDHCVFVKLEVDQDVEDVIIPKMLLQPLVENIWVHGDITRDGRQRIEISAHRLKGDFLQILVADNGIGISRERQRMLAEGKVQDHGGIGSAYIRNILQCYYGDEFIYEIRSEEGNGTIVSMIIPDQIKQ